MRIRNKEVDRKYGRAYKIALRLEGICTYCAKSFADGGRTTCAPCRALAKQRRDALKVAA